MALGKGLNALIGSAPAQTKKTHAEQKDARSASQKADAPSGILMIPLSQIHPNPAQPRKHFGEEELNDLVVSIRRHGILQPLVVSEEDDGTYEIIAGERRFRAAQAAGLPSVPCMVKPADAKQKLEMGLVENIQRKNLNAIEEAFAYQRLVDEFGMTQDQVAQQVGKSRSHVANMIRLMDLPQDVQKGLIEEKISPSKARALLGLPTIRQQLKAYYDIIGDEKISTRATEEMVRAKKSKVSRDPMLAAFESRLRDRLGTKVAITYIHGRGNIRIDFFSDEELHKLVGVIIGT